MGSRVKRDGLGVEEREYSKEAWNEMLNVGDGSTQEVLTLSGWYPNSIGIDNLSKTGCSIHPGQGYSIYKVYGVKY